MCSTTLRGAEGGGEVTGDRGDGVEDELSSCDRLTLLAGGGCCGTSDGDDLELER